MPAPGMQAPLAGEVLQKARCKLCSLDRECHMLTHQARQRCPLELGLNGNPFPVTSEME